jgi:putative flippase GtrA
MQRLYRFVVVGTVGFLVDASVLVMLVKFSGINVHFARLISFVTAVTITWIANRLFTFADRKSRYLAGEWLRYIFVNSVGGLINLLVFSALIVAHPSFEQTPVIPLAVASLVAMFFNFVAAGRLAFTGGAGAASREGKL